MGAMARHAHSVAKQDILSNQILDFEFKKLELNTIFLHFLKNLMVKYPHIHLRRSHTIPTAKNWEKKLNKKNCIQPIFYRFRFWFYRLYNHHHYSRHISNGIVCLHYVWTPESDRQFSGEIYISILCIWHIKKSWLGLINACFAPVWRDIFSSDTLALCLIFTILVS